MGISTGVRLNQGLGEVGKRNMSLSNFGSRSLSQNYIRQTLYQMKHAHPCLPNTMHIYICLQGTPLRRSGYAPFFFRLNSLGFAMPASTHRVMLWSATWAYGVRQLILSHSGYNLVFSQTRSSPDFRLANLRHLRQPKALTPKHFKGIQKPMW